MENFKTISRTSWREASISSPFDKKQRETGPFTNDFYGNDVDEGVQFPELIDFLKRGQSDCTLLLDWERFAGKIESHSVSPPMASTWGSPPALLQTRRSMPFTFRKSNGDLGKVNLSGRINKRCDYVAEEIGLTININPEEKELSAQLDFYYEGIFDQRKDAADTPKKGDYRMDEKYIAVSISSKDMEAICQIVGTIKGSDELLWIRERIGKEYVQKITNHRNSPEHIDFLYKNAPEFVFRKMSDSELLEDMATLANWGNSDWQEQANNALMKIILNFNEPIFLYKSLASNADLVVQLYRDAKSNPQMLVEALSLLGTFFCSAERDYRHIRIPVDDKHDIRSGFPRSDQDKKLNISVREKNPAFSAFMNYSPSPRAGVPYMANPELEFIEVAHYEDLHPLDMITVVDQDGKSAPVVALQILVMTDANAEKELLQYINVSLSIIGIFVGAGVLLRGAGVFWSTMAIADISLNAANLAIQAKEVKDELSKLPGGKWFVDNWDDIYGIAGFAMLSTASIRGILINGPIALERAAQLSARTNNVLKRLIAAAIMNVEISNFTKNTFRYLSYEEVRTFSAAADFGLEEFGAQMQEARLVMGVNKDGTMMSLFYRGEVVAKGNPVAVKNSLKSLFAFEKNKDAVIRFLDSLVDRINFREVDFYMGKIKRIEFDIIYTQKKLFVEEKSAERIYKLNPETGKPYGNAKEWAEKVVFTTTSERIDRLKYITDTKSKLISEAPSLEEMKKYRTLEFRFLESRQEFQKEVKKQIKNLSTKHPDWKFKARFGK